MNKNCAYVYKTLVKRILMSIITLSVEGFIKAIDNYHNRTADEVGEKPDNLSLKIKGEC